MNFILSLVGYRSSESSFCGVQPQERSACQSYGCARRAVVQMKTMEEVSKVGKKRTGNEITGKVYVCGDNIDTDQVFHAQQIQRY